MKEEHKNIEYLSFKQVILKNILNHPSKKYAG